MTMNSETTIDVDLAINFPAAWKPPQGSIRCWSGRDIGNRRSYDCFRQHAELPTASMTKGLIWTGERKTLQTQAH